MLTQGFFVQNLAHKQTTIQSLSGGTLRILGAFATIEDAQVCVAKQADLWPDLETRISPMHAWRLVSKDLLDVDTQTHQFLDLLDAYSEHRKEVYEDVARRAAQKNVIDDAAPKNVIDDAVKIAVHKNVIDDAAHKNVIDVSASSSAGLASKMNLPEVPRDLEVRLQKFVGLAILPDIASEKAKKDLKDHEPAFQVLCVAETEDEIEKQFHQWSERYLTDDSHGLFSSVPLACVSMQETFRPAWALSVSTRRVTRDERLAQIREAFQHAKDQAEIA